jgi:hypothetical protein
MQSRRHPLQAMLAGIGCPAVRRVLRRALVGALAVAAAARAQSADISVQDIANAERDEKAAVAKVEAEHGDKPPQELSSGERSQIVREQQAASRAVLEQRSLDAKALATRVMRLTPDERAQVEAEKARMDQEEKARLEREAAANAAPQEVEITRGVDEKHPVDLYRAPGEPEVEHLSEGGEADEAPEAKPKKGHQGGKAPPMKNPPHGKKSRHK